MNFPVNTHQQKLCKKCNKNKELNQFNKPSSKTCKSCNSLQREFKSSYLLQEEFSSIKLNPISTPCSKCNNPITLDDSFKGGLKASKNLNRVCPGCKKLMAQKANMEYTEAYLLRLAKQRAKRDGISFELMEEDIKIPVFCPVLGTPIVVGGTKEHHGDSPSIDRLVPELGYIKSNIRVISFRANMLKNNATINELKLVLEYMIREGCK